MENKINSKDISVVIQGAIDECFTPKCIRSIRKYLPKAEIILSTWEGSKVQDLDYDILVENKDPGAEVFCASGKPHNLNREILSTSNGIKKSTRKYVLKLRSDMTLIGTKFLTYFDKYEKRNNKYKVFNKRLLINSFYTRKSDWYLFHPSDWMTFGLKEDCLNFWDVPLAPEPETSKYFINNPQIVHQEGLWTRWHAEEYIWLSCLAKNGYKIDFDNYMVKTPELIYASDLSLINNFVILNYKSQCDILNQKYLEFSTDMDIADHYDWLIQYKEFCDKSLKIPLKYWWANQLGLRKFTFTIQKHISRLKNKELFISKRLEQIISIIYHILNFISSLIINIPRLIIKYYSKSSLD